MSHILSSLYCINAPLLLLRLLRASPKAEVAFIHANNREALVIRTTVHLPYILHTSYKICALIFGNAPFLNQMRIKRVLFKNLSYRRVADAIYIIHLYHSF